MKAGVRKAWLVGFLVACGGGGSGPGGVTSGASCDELCGAAAACDEPPASAAECDVRCDAQRGHFHQAAWDAYAACVSGAACESPDACIEEAILASSPAASDAFLRDICDWAVGCAGGAWTHEMCVDMLGSLGDDEDAGAPSSGPWDYVRLLKGSSVQCVSGCIRRLSCAEADFGAAGYACAQDCGLEALGAFGEAPAMDPTCEQEHGDCGDHGGIVENEFGGCDCVCDDGYVSSSWVCVPGCAQTGCDGHGSCDPSGTCVCDEGYYAVQSATEGGCVALPTYVDLATAERTSCAVRDSGEVECWGDTSDAVLELPDPNEGFTSVVMGSGPIDSAACALRADGTAVCWGNVLAPDERLAPDFRSLSLEGDAGCGVLLDGSVSCWGFSAYGITTPSDPAGFVEVARGDRMACGIREGGAVECWGDATVVGEVPTDIDDAEQVCAGSGGSCARRADGSITCFGVGSFVGMEVPPPNEGFTDVTCGEYHACGLRADGTPACWGIGAIVELAPPADRASGYTKLEAGREHTCGLRDDGSIACWGRDTYNQAPEERTARPGSP